MSWKGVRTTRGEELEETHSVCLGGRGVGGEGADGGETGMAGRLGDGDAPCGGAEGGARRELLDAGEGVHGGGRRRRRRRGRRGRGAENERGK